MNTTKVIIITSGGTIDDVISDMAVEYDVFDWDDFGDDPIQEWETTWKHDKTLKEFAPEAYSSAKKLYLQAKKEAEEELNQMFPLPANRAEAAQKLFNSRDYLIKAGIEDTEPLVLLSLAEGRVWAEPLTGEVLLKL